MPLEKESPWVASRWTSSSPRFRFKDIRFPAGVNQSFIRASADGVRFEGIRVGDTSAADANALQLATEGDVRNVTFPTDDGRQ